MAPVDWNDARTRVVDYCRESPPPRFQRFSLLRIIAMAVVHGGDAVFRVI